MSLSPPTRWISTFMITRLLIILASPYLVAAPVLQAARITPAEAGTYFHLSPFTTDDRKELPPEQFAELVGELSKQFPEKRWVISCAPTERERRKMEVLLPLLPVLPWRVFAGKLNLVQLAAVIRHSALHLCGDTGTLHLALMTGARSVAWFWPNPGMQIWVPIGPSHRTLVGINKPEVDYLCDIETAGLVSAVTSILCEPPSPAPEPGREIPHKKN